MKKLLFIPLLALPLAWFFFNQVPEPPQITLGAETASSTTITAAGTYSITISPDTCRVFVGLWGGGGSGFDGTNSGGGAGGGGGAFASSTLDVPAEVTVGTTYTLVVGAGGAVSGANGATSTWASTVISAAPGWGGNAIIGTRPGGLGGATASSTGDFESAGGNGGFGLNDDDGGGGGGGAGGPGGAGGAGANGQATTGGGGGEGNGGAAGSGVTGGTGGTGGDGGNGGSGAQGVDGGAAAGIGGGGGGGGDNGTTGGNGGAPGGGGGGAELTDWVGGAGGAVITEIIDPVACASAAAAPNAITSDFVIFE